MGHPVVERLGILGDGQLARMLAEAAVPLGIRTVVLASTADSPGAQIASETVLGEVTDALAVERFLSRVQVVVYENEFVAAATLRECAARFPDVVFRPSLDALELVRDKLAQKKMFTECEIPTARYTPYEQGSIDEFLDKAHAAQGGAIVLKWGGMGYDGKGIWFESGETREGARAFCEEALRKGVSLYAEERVAFRRELAIIGCRTVQGEAHHYPLVLCEQREGICERVSGPARAFGVPPYVETQARDFAVSIGRRAELVGTFALELFETSSGLLVNEMAPRVHNSGHFTQDAANVSQFSNHVRAACQLPLGSTQSSPAFFMLNLLGPAGVTRDLVPKPEQIAGVTLHWYGKREIRPKRKMGHLNVTCNRPSDLPAAIKSAEACRAAWEEKVRS